MNVIYFCFNGGVLEGKDVDILYNIKRDLFISLFSSLYPHNFHYL